MAGLCTLLLLTLASAASSAGIQIVPEKKIQYTAVVARDHGHRVALFRSFTVYGTGGERAFWGCDNGGSGRALRKCHSKHQHVRVSYPHPGAVTISGLNYLVPVGWNLWVDVEQPGYAGRYIVFTPRLRRGRMSLAKTRGCLRPGYSDPISCRASSTGSSSASGGGSGGGGASGGGAGPATYTFTASVSGTGSGKITGSGISCPSTCSASDKAGATVTLTAAPSAGSTFAGWSGACTGTGTTCTFTLSGDTTVEASFKIDSEALTVTRSGNGTVTGTGINCGSTCSASLAYGTPVTLTAAPATGSSFTGWSGACSGTGICQFTIGSAASVTANFTLQSETLSINRSGPGQGVVTGPGISCGGTCSVTVAYGTTITISPNVPWDVRFDAGWQGGGCAGTGSCTITMTSNDTVGAPFDGYFESTSSAGASTFSNPSNESGKGPQVYGTVQISCYVTGLAVSDGNPYYYRLTSNPSLYATADPFYNNGATSGSLVGTPWIDGAVPHC